MRFTHCLAGLAMLLSSTAFAGARDELNAFTANLQGLQGEFVQQVYDENGRVKETSAGTVAVSKPRLFRWEYAQPYPQLIVADGERVWVYDPDLEQVTVRPQGPEEQDSPLAALIDPVRLDADYAVAEDGSAEGMEWLQVRPKGQGEQGFQSARLGFSTGALVRMEVIDTLGQRTLISFRDWKRNPGFEEGTFRFDPPAGVDVVGDH